MTLFAIAASIAALTALQNPSNGRSPTECREWRECRQLALDAYGRGEYERFHDLAWRTVQTGPARDRDLMYLLARAQSLSGRPHDALVMLGRLADAGFVSDAATNDDFRAVRELRQWPELEERLASVAAPGTNPSPVVSGPSRTGSASGFSGTRNTPETAPEALTTSAAPKLPTSLLQAEDALRVPGAKLAAAGLAYDRVSSRFVVADAHDRKLVIIDERSRHVVDFVTSTSAGFYDVTALAIDAARGDLWVVSAEPASAASDRPPASALHKLQLVSGRPLDRIPVPDALLPARLDDVSVTPDGTVLMLDTIGNRILRVRPATHNFSTVATLNLDHPTSLAPVDDRIVYVAHASGIARVDLAAGNVAPLADSRDLLAGVERVRWTRGSLVGIQRRADGSRRVLRIRIDRGRAAAIDIIDHDIPEADGPTLTVSDDEVYVLVQPGDAIVRRTRLPRDR